MTTIMGLNNTEQLYTHVSESIDCSSSSCPPSTNSEESTQEGYLILTFDKSKRARVKTAVFADVSDCHFADDFDEDILNEEDNDLLYGWTDGEHNSSDLKQHPDPGENTVPAHSSSSENTTTLNPASAARNSADCYGEAVWVGEGDVTEAELKPVCEKESIDQHRLIRTSPVIKCPRNEMSEIHDLQSSPMKLSTEQSAVHPKLADSFRISQCVPNTLVHSDSGQQRPLSVSVRWTNRFPSQPPSWSQFRSTGLVRNGFSSNDYDPGNEKYPRKMLRCEACGKYYRNEYSLHHHICLKRKDVWKKGDIPSDVVDGQLVYFCPTCHKPFKWLGNLTRHFYVHTGQRFFKCDVCAKEFFSAYQVKRHMNSHTGRRFKCEVCEKPFTCKYACAWHTRQHYTYAE